MELDRLNYLMGEAIKEGTLACQKEEVPIGAILIHDDKIIARAHNLVEKNNLALEHAEMQVIKMASKKIGNWRLLDTTLVTTLEPCPMCTGAIRLARIPNVVFGAYDKRMGAMSSKWNLSEDTNLGPAPKVYSGIREEECRKLLVDFFKDKRK